MNDQKRKSSRIHVLCDDLVLFRLRSKKVSPVCTGAAFLFVERSRSENHCQENLHSSNRTKGAKTNDLASFCAHWTQKRGPKPLQKLRGAAKLQSKKISVSGACERKLGCVLSYLENATRIPLPRKIAEHYKEKTSFVNFNHIWSIFSSTMSKLQ